MSLILPTATRFYKICAFLGTIIIIADLALSWVRIDAFESSVTEVFESMIRTQMEMDGLVQEKQHVEKVLKQTSKNSKENVSVDGIEYTPYEVERLKNEYSSIQLYIQEKQLDLASLASQKKFVMNEVRILFLVSLLFLVLGTILAAFGYLAWYFKIELFEDRRRKPR